MKKLFLFLLVIPLLLASCEPDRIFTEMSYEINADSIAKAQHLRDSLLLAAILNHKDSTNITVNVTVIIKDSININIDSHDTTNITIINPPIQPPKDPTTVYQTIFYNVVQPTCAVATGTVTLTGLPDGVWTISPFNISSVGTTKTFTGLKPGEYIIVITNTSGYTSPPIMITINEQPLPPKAPIIGEIKQPTKTVSTGSVTLTGLPKTGVWILTRYPDKFIMMGTGETVTVTGLKAYVEGAKCTEATYTFTVMTAEGCTSVVSEKVTIKSYN